MCALNLFLLARYVLQTHTCFKTSAAIPHWKRCWTTSSLQNPKLYHKIWQSLSGKCALMVKLSKRQETQAANAASNWANLLPVTKPCAVLFTRTSASTVLLKIPKSVRALPTSARAGNQHQPNYGLICKWLLDLPYSPAKKKTMVIY